MDYRDINDYEIIYMVKENDDRAREIVFKKYLPIINKIAGKYIAYAKNFGVEFDDLVQEGYIALNNAIDKYDQNATSLFYSYASLCIGRSIQTYCRNISNNKNKILNFSVREESILNIKDDSLNPEDIVFGILLEEKFIYFKNLFDLTQSCIFELRYNGFSYKEISKLLDISLNVIDGSLYKIRKALREYLVKEEFN